MSEKRWKQNKDELIEECCDCNEFHSDRQTDYEFVCEIDCHRDADLRGLYLSCPLPTEQDVVVVEGIITKRDGRILLLDGDAIHD